MEKIVKYKNVDLQEEPRVDMTSPRTSSSRHTDMLLSQRSNYRFHIAKIKEMKIFN